jgi:Flp pilus assembly CpaE family ATPase
MASYVVLDLPSTPSDANQALVGCCDVLGLVVEANRVGLAAAHKTLETLALWRSRRDRVEVVVVNRNSCSLGATPEEVAIELACPLLGALPADTEGAATALDLGLTVLLGQPNSPLARALNELTDRLAQQESVVARGH